MAGVPLWRASKAPSRDSLDCKRAEIEFDNTQDNANHIHSVWRDFSGDFGEEIAETPVRFLETPWVETARRQLETTALSLEEVAVGLVGSDL